MLLSKSLIALATYAFVGSNALGINCRGSGLCTGSKGILGQAQGQLRGMDQNQQFSDGQHITCVKTSNIGEPSLCIFYQKTNGRKWTVAQTVNYVQALIDHKCSACGSVPTDSGNNVNNGELTANMVTNAQPGVDKRSEEAFPKAAVQEKYSQPTKRKEAALGINCRGSSTCGVGGIGHSPAGTLEKVRDAVAAGPDGHWSNGQQIACVPHVTGRLCAFYQNIGDRTFTKDQSVTYLDQLRSHGCRNCGSIPTDDSGNDTSKGELTVNFVS
ncbi:hypothetical protein V495_08541 [Pseudogymnoascus sp. VKM F-4514 (FW-929)]|nr:hypothetical protein V495_08541 [Pseudogymnoascus sp. VKM F-4514 (FW-929)]KFY52022.1 hypothetical protein V497_08694 [Pseudogymnoascus sp. VKM F-4516 (FW-969)]